MSLRQAIPGELLSSIARFRFAYRSHPKPKPSVRLLKNSERLPSQNSTVSALGFIAPLSFLCINRDLCTTRRNTKCLLSVTYGVWVHSHFVESLPCAKSLI